MQEYGEHKDKIRELESENERLTAERDEARAEVDKLSRKKVKIAEIESIEAKESMFGKKVTLSKEDYDKLNDTAKKYVAMEKTTKKLKSERDTAVQRYDELKKKYNSASTELSAYKKKEDEKRYFSRENLNKQTRQISDREKLRKAVAFIDACGLRSDYEKFRCNVTRRTELE